MAGKKPYRGVCLPAVVMIFPVTGNRRTLVTGHPEERYTFDGWPSSACPSFSTTYDAWKSAVVLPFEKLPGDSPPSRAAEPIAWGSDAPGELNPWIVLSHEDGAETVALWQLRDSPTAAIAFFSTEDKAARYAESAALVDFKVVRLESLAVVRLLVDAFKLGHKYAALDASGESVRNVFDVADVLRAARTRLKSQ